MQYRKYEVWHDESKEGGYHHGVLFVPVDKRDEIIEKLKEIRDMYSIPYEQKIKFAKSLKRYRIGRVVENNLVLFSYIIQTNKSNIPIKIYKLSKKNKHNNYVNYLKVVGSFGCHFGLLRIADNLNSLHLNTYAEKVEITFRFILKGCCHSMFSMENPIEIVKFHFDGDEHYHRPINLKAIVKGKLRDYVKISNDISIDARQRDKRKDDTGLMIDFVDNIVGAFRSKLNNESDEYNILYPLSKIWSRLTENKIFMLHKSRWYRSIVLSELVVNRKTNTLEFPDVFRNSNQEKLF